MNSESLTEYKIC